MHVHTIWAAGGPGACIADFLVSKVVDGVDFTSSIPMLKIGSISIPIDKVKSVVRSE